MYLPYDLEDNFKLVYKNLFTRINYMLDNLPETQTIIINWVLKNIDT